MLPNFFVVGTQKAGTTSLHNYLSCHPEIYLPAQKETKFFVDDEQYAKGISYYETEFFSGWDGEKAVGEIDPDYIYFEQALDRMRQHLNLEAMKFIFLLRNPINRAFSHYLMTYRRGLEPLSFEEAIKVEEGRITKGYSEKMHYSYVSRGFYMRQIKRFLEYVDKSQMLFLFSEELKTNPQVCLKTIFSFLEVSDDVIPSNINEKFHCSTVPRNMALMQRIQRQSFEKKIVRLLIPWKNFRHKLRQKLIDFNQTHHHNFTLRDDTRQELAKIFSEENNMLAEFLGKNLSKWV